jgi:hypothetical protein
MELLDRRKGRGAPYLVFTSAGDRSNLARWLRGRRNFDVWITYYGDHPGRYSDSGDLYNARKGSKFQNLKFAYQTWPDLLGAYSAVMVMDDDVLISASDISRLFELREELDLWVLQPAFSPRGKISWPITRVRWRSELRYTNYVEMTCPLFRRDKLDAFMSVYDPVLAGYGADWWFLHVLGSAVEGRIAIVDSITCVNPHRSSKGGIREINRLQSHEQRVAVWNEVRQRYGIKADRRGHREFRVVLKPPPWRWLSPLVHVPLDAYAGVRRIGWRLQERVQRWSRSAGPG